jgi:hypothetical protein
MIRKVEGYNAWILKNKDLPILDNICKNTRWNDVVRLPLFGLHFYYYNVWSDDWPDEEELVLSIYYPYGHERTNGCNYKSLDFLEKVNKTWNKFYEENTRK